MTPEAREMRRRCVQVAEEFAAGCDQAVRELMEEGETGEVGIWRRTAGAAREIAKRIRKLKCD